VSLETVAPFWRHRRYRGPVVSIQIKHVPDDVHAVLKRRAAAARQSLQEYLLDKLVAEATQPTMKEIFDEIREEIDREGAGPEIPTEVILQSIREAREGL
jgi:hypothetical protein